MNFRVLNSLFIKLYIFSILPPSIFPITNCIFGMNQRYVPYMYQQERRIGSYGELWKKHKSGELGDLGKTEENKKSVYRQVTQLQE